MVAGDGDKRILDERDSSDEQIDPETFANCNIGLTVLGTEFGCGKTVLLTGLTAMLKSEGFKVRALKPIVSGTNEDWQAELSFISAITGTGKVSPVGVLETVAGIDGEQWQQVLNQVSEGAVPTFIELPGSSAAPLCFYKSESTLAWKDTSDLALELAFPCLLVAKHNFSALEKLTVHANYILDKGLELLGLITVEVYPNAESQRISREFLELSLMARTGVPYLGCINHSRSISVPQVNQGNLIKLTSAGIEILEVMKALNLPVPASS